MKTSIKGKTIHPICWAVVLSLALVWLPSLALAGQSECSVACVASGSVSIQYGCHTTGSLCNIASPTDEDNYTFTGSIGDNVRITLRSLSGCFNPRLEVRDPDGYLILDTWCSGLCGGQCCGCTVQVDPNTTPALPTLTKPGSYRVTVSAHAADSSGDYDFQVEKIYPFPNPPGLGYDAPMEDDISPTADTDFYAFEGVAGSKVRITLRSLSDCFNPRLEIWDPDGTGIVRTYCSGLCGGQCCGCTVQVDPDTTPALPTLTKPGLYLVAVSDEVLLRGVGGTYEIDLGCLFGACPICTDNDGDGYGNPASPHCPHPELDCDDTNPNVNPGALEECGKTTCEDGLDNDCNGLIDAADPACKTWCTQQAQEAQASTLGTMNNSSSIPPNLLAFLVVPVSVVLIWKGFRRKR